MSEPFLGEIRIFGGNFEPKGWAAFCYGQLLPIRQYAALFSLLGTYYGGDGKNDFRTAKFTRLCSGRPGPGTRCVAIRSRTIRRYAHADLIQQQVPPHTHTSNAGAPGRANSNSVTDNLLHHCPGGNLSGSALVRPALQLEIHRIFANYSEA